ncbi:hypothetical protein Q4F19_10860 [Sphingomonas sp. BIUV-7]|uniref:Uncharacterized protein n=1 Tax=Sphingomonas natans TaxID=3063330 RepID=A0ABT8Y974_9SPHN|nr:hypothetical protein [Sphingomonas sp. BIUV-7]MDO6414881.1 hypothetical protein [Sphingomonas sp. BIUV-7]
MSVSFKPPKTLDLLVQWDVSHLRKASFQCGLDNACATVRVVGGGVWREADAQLYFTQQRRIIDEARRRFGALRVLFDVRDWVVENPQSVLQFQAMNAEIYKPEDRLAAVVRSSVDKQHPRAALAVGTREVFISANAAETWLQAYATGGDARDAAPSTAALHATFPSRSR